MNPTSISQPQSGSTEATTQGGVKSTIAEAKETVKGKARQTAESVKTAVSDTATRLKDQTTQAATQKKEQAADKIGGYSSAIRETAQSLEEQDPNLAWLTRSAADRIQGIADYVRTSDFAALKTDAEGIARRHPGLFLGGMFVLGLVAGNLMKAKPETQDLDYGTSDDFGGEGQIPQGYEPAESTYSSSGMMGDQTSGSGASSGAQI